MPEETTTTNQLLGTASGAFDSPRPELAPEGTHVLTVARVTAEPTRANDAINYNFVLGGDFSRRVNGAEDTYRGVAFARITVKPEWFDLAFIAQSAHATAEYNRLPRKRGKSPEQEQFLATSNNKELIRAGIAFAQVNRVLSYLGKVDADTGETDWLSFPDLVQTLEGQTVRTRVVHTDVNNITRREAARLQVLFDEDSARAEADFLYLKA